MDNAYQTSCPTNGIIWVAGLFALAYCQNRFDLLSIVHQMIG